MDYIVVGCICLIVGVFIGDQVSGRSIVAAKEKKIAELERRLRGSK